MMWSSIDNVTITFFISNQCKQLSNLKNPQNKCMEGKPVPSKYVFDSDVLKPEYSGCICINSNWFTQKNKCK